MKAKSSDDPEYFQALETLAAVFGVALVPCDLPGGAVSTLPNGRIVIFLPKGASAREQGAIVGQQLLELQVKAIA